MHPFNIDLHCHSVYSDGLLSIETLLKEALEAGLHTLALTDHDTLLGVPHLQAAAKNKPIQIIPGVELSVRWKKYEIHIIGLQVNLTNPHFQTLLLQQNERRTQRAIQIALLLEKTGIQYVYQKACDLAGHQRIGRPHLAQVLVNEGVVPDLKTAFSRYLVRGRTAYVPTAWITLEEAVESIRQAGGYAVIAHPLKYKLTRSKLNVLINTFKEAGGTAIEVVSGELPTAAIYEMALLCNHYELLASTGSDYHGMPHARIKLGRQQPLPPHCKPVWSLWEGN